MAELLITVFLLLALENALFTVVFKNTRFLAFSYETGNVFLYAIMLGAIPALSVIVSAMISDTESMLLAVLISVVLAGAVTAYEKFAKKSDDWYFALSLVINTAVVVLLSTVFAKKNIAGSATVCAVFSGISAAVSAVFLRRQKQLLSYEAQYSHDMPRFGSACTDCDCGVFRFCSLREK